VITKAAKGTGRHQAPVDNSHDKPQKRLTKKGQSHRQDGAVRKVKDELIKDEFSASPSASSSSYLHHKGGSQSSQSSRKYEGSRKSSSSRQKHSKKDKKGMKSKRQKDSDSSTEWKSRGLKSKKPKRAVSSFPYSSDDSD
jgi:hypothetical protein